MTINRVGVYGTLREGEGNWSWALNKKPVFSGTVLLPGHAMSALHGGFPGVKAVDRDTEQPFLIEVYEVDEEQFDNMDRLEGHPTFYKRKVFEIPGYEYPVWVYILQSPPTDSDIWIQDFVEYQNWNRREWV